MILIYLNNESSSIKEGDGGGGGCEFFQTEHSAREVSNKVANRCKDLPRDLDLQRSHLYKGRKALLLWA